MRAWCQVAISWEESSGQFLQYRAPSILDDYEGIIPIAICPNDSRIRQHSRFYSRHNYSTCVKRRLAWGSRCGIWLRGFQAISPLRTREAPLPILHLGIIFRHLTEKAMGIPSSSLLLYAYQVPNKASTYSASRSLIWWGDLRVHTFLH